MIHADFLRGIDRRTFLKIVSLTGVAGLVYPRGLIASIISADQTRVIIVEDDGATTDMSINAAVVRTMMNAGIRALTGEYDVGEAWKSLFPGIGTSSSIAIKVNCLNSLMPTHPEVTEAVVLGLKQMSFGGIPFPENNIIIYDRLDTELSSAGYSLNTSGAGVRCFGTDSGGGYSSESYDVYGRPERISRIVADMADYLIDISVLKSHSMAGTTLCLKNHFGTCDHPNGLHGVNCDPYIPALNALAPIRDKQCVNVCDAVLGIVSGSYPQIAPNKIIISRDVVAVDYWGRDILANEGCSTIPLADHIDTAAEEPYSLGTNDPAEMDVVNITDPATGTDPPELDAGRVILEQNHPNPFTRRTQVRFYTREPGNLAMTIYDPAGRRVRRLVDGTFGPGWHREVWDGFDDSGLRVSSGVYFLQLRTTGTEQTIIMQMLH
jgi:uncharacterized protein (DUF362 family)